MQVAIHKKNEGPIETKPKEYLNSLEIAKQIIHNTKGYQQILIIYKNKKSHNYESFSKHISDLLSHDQMSYKNSYKIIRDINEAIKPDINTAGNQPKSIFDGFAFYWKSKLKPDYQTLRNSLIKDLQSFSHLLIPGIVKFLNDIGSIYDIRGNIIDDMIGHVNKILDQPKITKKNCICSLMIISFLKIYEQFAVASLIQLAIIPQYNQVAFFFKGIIKHGKQVLGFDGDVLNVQDSVMIDQGQPKKRKYYHSFIDQYVQKCIRQNRVKEIQAMIKQNNRNVNDFPQLLEIQREKYIRYIQRSHKLHFVQLMLNGNQKTVKKDFECLCNILVSSGRQREAYFFIKKYKLQGCSAHKQLTKRSFKPNPQDHNLKNVLIQKDRFGATELRVLHQVKDFIELQDFGLDQGDVQFIDQKNYDIKHMNRIFDSSIIGIDCQKSGGRSPFDPVHVTLAQISTSGNEKTEKPDKIFLFDVVSLLQNQEFKKQIDNLFTNYKGKIVGQDVMNDIRQLLKELNIKAKGQNLKKIKVQDTMLAFREKYKNQKKSGLDYIANFLFKKPLSKYEQCSGWRNRPLRKAQIHYAALDSYLPIKILQELQKNN